jgi:hypothetical protein
MIVRSAISSLFEAKKVGEFEMANLSNSLNHPTEKRVDDISFRNLSPKGMEYLYGMRPENVQN